MFFGRARSKVSLLESSTAENILVESVETYQFLVKTVETYRFLVKSVETPIFAPDGRNIKWAPRPEKRKYLHFFFSQLFLFYTKKTRLKKNFLACHNHFRRRIFYSIMCLMYLIYPTSNCTRRCATKKANGLLGNIPATADSYLKQNGKMQNLAEQTIFFRFSITQTFFQEKLN